MLLGNIQLAWTNIGSYNDECNLFLCDSLVSFRRFDSYSCKWNYSEIKQWLNNEFINSSFSDEQRAMLVRNDELDCFVFLLSDFEYLKYMDSIPSILASWWLRSRGQNSYDALSVCHTGLISDVSMHVGHCCGVRPAILLRKIKEADNER